MAMVTFTEEFLQNLERNDVEAIKSKINIAKSIYHGALISHILHWAYQKSSIEVFQLIVDSIDSVDNNFVSSKMIKCSHEGQLDDLKVLLDRYPQIPFDICEMIKPSMYIESIPAVLDMLADRPKQVTNAKEALIRCFFELKFLDGRPVNNPADVCCKYYGNHTYARDVTYKLADMTQFFNEHELVAVLLCHDECEKAIKLLGAMNLDPHISHLTEEDTCHIFREGNVEAIQVLLKYYYHDAFFILKKSILQDLCERVNMSSLIELFDMITEKYSLEAWDVSAYSVRSLEGGMLVNFRIIKERYPDFDFGVSISMANIANSSGSYKKYNTIVDEVRKMVPNRK